MAERFNAAVLKTVDGVSRPGVRIPVSPLLNTLIPNVDNHLEYLHSPVFDLPEERTP